MPVWGHYAVLMTPRRMGNSFPEICWQRFWS